MHKIDFINLVTKMYDDTMEVVRTEDEEKMMGRLLTLANRAKEEDPTALLEVAVFTKIMHELSKEK